MSRFMDNRAERVRFRLCSMCKKNSHSSCNSVWCPCQVCDAVVDKEVQQCSPK